MAKNVKTTKTEARSNFDAILQMVPAERIAAKLAERTKESAEKAHGQIKGLANRLNQEGGIVAERSREIVEQFVSVVTELKGNDEVVVMLLNRFQKAVVFRTAKTGPRDSSWIRDLRAGLPRLEKDGKYYAYKEISIEEALQICNEMGHELPVSSEDSLDEAAEVAGEEEAEA